MTPTQATATPAPCPFCNTELVLYKPRHGSDYYQHQRNECLLSVTGMGDPIIVFDDVAHIAAWNRRSSVPTPMSDTAAAQTCMGCMSPEACIARGQCDYGDKVPMSDSTVAAGGDEMAQVEQACQLSAAEWQAVAEQAERDRAGYASAFYRIAEVLGIPAQANTPEAVFEREMLPALRASLSATGVPTQPSGWVLVPEEPTTAMLEAAYKAFQTAAPSLIGFNAKDRAYKAMLQHAPKPPAPAVAVIPERQGSVHPAAPSSPSDLRSVPLPEPRALDRSELPVRPLGCVKPDSDQQVFFYEQDFYVLSNFSAFTLQWAGRRFDTSEAAYHWEKFADCDAEVQDMILQAPSAHAAFKIAESQKALRRVDWDQVKVSVMAAILRAKVDQHEYVRRKLLATGDRELIEDSWRDDYWGWGPNRDGKNMVGNLWMELRAELRATPPTAARVVHSAPQAHGLEQGADRRSSSYSQRPDDGEQA